ncbi:MAG: hypothetical protein GY751_09760 [Bacteroidetes bacterium]|nr:hypothetical protein [Bacteroidota bacterium]
MTDHSHIDDQFRQSRGDWEGEPSDATWDRLRGRLDNYNADGISRRKMIFRLAVAASLTILLGLSFAMFNQSMDVAGFHAVNTEQEIPVHENVFSTDIEMESEEVIDINIPTFSDKVIPEKPTMASSTPNTIPASAKSVTPAFEIVDDQDEMTEFATDEIHADTYKSDDVSISAPSGGSSGEAFLTDTHIDSEEADQAFEDVEELTEPEILTETAVANAIGIKQTKSEHKKREKARTYSSRSLAPAESYERMDDRAEGFVQKSLIILVPNESKNRCIYTALLVENEKFYIDRCQSDAYDLIRDESLPLDRSILQELLDADVEQIQQIGKDNAPRNCSEALPELQLIYRYGTDLSYFDETIKWSADSDCLTEEAKKIIIHLNKLVRTLDR